eukprot:gene8621-6053_t
MKRIRGLPNACCPLFARYLTLQPSCTKDPVRYPSGFIPLDGSEPIETIYALVKAGHFVAPLTKIETIHSVFHGIKKLCILEHPLIQGADIVHAVVAQTELLNRVLIRRDFWTLSDFNDPELNRSFGVQNLFFDNYKWSQVLWKRFQQFVEEYFPISEHTHLYYHEYEQLIKSFAVFEKGLKVYPAVPKNVLLHPAYGVPIPSKVSLEPIMLLKRWLMNFRRPLMLNRALVVNSGCGAIALATSHAGVPMVCGVDSLPRAIQACRKDALSDKRFSSVKFQVAEFLPPKPPAMKYDVVIYYPDEKIVEIISGPLQNIYAPNVSGYAGKFEQFFDDVEDHLTDTGVVLICCSNLMSLLQPLEPHPIEYEVKVNRRFVIMDYLDTPVKNSPKLSSASGSTAIPAGMRKKLRSELWALHKLGALEHYGYLHGIPGAQPPAIAGKWKGSQMGLERQRKIRDHVESMGEDWGTYKTRLLTMLQEQSDTEEDDYAAAVRMSLDPTYPQELAERAKRRIEERLNDEKEFHDSVAKNYANISPREAFDRKY